jgi:chaperonin GroES
MKRGKVARPSEGFRSELNPRPSVQEFNRSNNNLSIEEEYSMATKTASRIRPLGDRILVKRVEESETMQGGIYIPDTAKEKPTQGEIIAVGPGRRADDGTITKLEVKPGDRVLMSKYAGTEVKIDGDEYLILREDDVLGILEK